jgi:hypothetical protein
MVNFRVAGPEEAKNLGGAKVLRLIQIRVAPPSLKESRRLVKTILQPRIADSASRKTVSFSSARTTKRFTVAPR